MGHVDRTKIKELEARVERLRTELHDKVGHHKANLSDPAILPLSKELDTLIIAYMKAKNENNR